MATSLAMTDISPATLEFVENPAEANARAVNQIRKWGCQFEGKDPASFLERLEELWAGYQISDA